MARKTKRRNKVERGASIGARVVGRTVSLVAKTLVTFILIGVITGCIVITAMMIYVMNFMDNDNSISLDDISLSFTTMFYAKNEEGSWEEIYRMSGDENRIEVSIDDIPEYVQNAFIATEDKRFREHEGVDWIRTASVTINALMNASLDGAGGSTITQQLVKNVTSDDDVTPVRKLREIFRALQLERDYSKDEILESYLNIIFLGGRTYGVEAAAQNYFGCHVWELTVPQAASLAAMTKSPNSMRPDTHAEKNLVRRNNYVLREMYSQGYITEAEYQEYIATPVVTVGQDEETYTALVDYMLEDDPDNAYDPYITQEQHDNLIANRIVVTDEFAGDSTETLSSGVTSYYIDTVIRDVTADLMEENNWTEDYADAQLRSGGYRIYTCLDQSIQSHLEEKFCDWTTFSSSQLAANSNGETPEAAMVIMDYEGHILALVGGKGEKTNTLSFNRATQATRSPGSAIKPLASYSQALEYDMITWSTTLNDSPVKKDDEGNDWPKNYERDYRGNMTVVEALRISRNTIPVKILQQLTPEKSLDFLRNKLGFTTLDDRDASLAPLGVGSLTYGVHLDELTAAYAIFGNGGYYYEPIVYERIEDTSGNLVLDNTSQKTRALSEDTAYVMNRLLKVVCDSGTGRQAYIGDMPVVGKTGTTTDYYDMSFVGLTPYYVAGVWTGYDTQATLPSSQMYDCDTIWANVMKDLHADLEVVDFTASENVVEAEYCTITGLLASDGCPTATGYYKSSALPDYCSGHYSSSSSSSSSSGNDDSTDDSGDSTESSGDSAESGDSGSYTVSEGDSPDTAVNPDA